MIKPSRAQMKRLLGLLEKQANDLVPTCRWLIVGRHLAETLDSDFCREPSLDQLLQLMRWAKDQDPALIDSATLLAAASPHAEELHIEVQLDALVDPDPDAWNHPVQILARPRQPYPVLLAACRRRLGRAKDKGLKERLRTVEKKLRRTIELEEKARRRRQRMREKERMKEAGEEESVH